MKNTIQEAIVKPGRAFRGFKDMLSQQKMRDSQGVSELAPHISEIEKYIDEATVSFEFECIMDLNEVYFASVIEEVEVPDAIDLILVDSDIYDFLQTYFPVNLNAKAWDKLEERYQSYLLYHYEENDYDSAEDFGDDYSIETFCDNIFSNASVVVNNYKFSNPLHGFGDYGHEILTGEYHYEDIEVDKSHEDFYNEVYPIIKNRINRIFGNQEIYISGEPHAYSPMFKKSHPDAWFIEPDGSLDLDDYHERVPAEVITPRWPASVAIENMKLFKEKVFDFFDGSTDESDTDIGCHTNISFENRSVDLVKLILLSNSAFWASEFGREENRYAKNQYQIIVNRVRNTPNIESMSLEDFKDLLADNIKREKFTDINILKDNVVEFRFPGNDYFGGHFDLLINNTKWLIFSMTVAAVPELFKTQYTSLLLRLKRTLANPGEVYAFNYNFISYLMELVSITDVNQGIEVINKFNNLYNKDDSAAFLKVDNIKTTFDDVISLIDRLNKPVSIKDELTKREIKYLLTLTGKNRKLYSILRIFLTKVGVTGI